MRAGVAAAAAILGYAAWEYYKRDQEEAAPEDSGGDAWVGVFDDVVSQVEGVFDMATVSIDEGLSHPNVRAFLALIRTGEGTADSNGYRRIFAGRLFDSFADHPRIAVTANLGGKPITSTAAGAYQILSRTWDSYRAMWGISDFSPASQDRFAVGLIRRRGALRDVMAGRFDVAIQKCAAEWASLPGSPYGQPTLSMDKARAVLAAAGGQFATA